VSNPSLINILPTSEGLTITITEVLDREFTGSTNRIFTEAEEKILENKSLEDLNLSVRAFNCIKASKIDSLRQLLDYSEDDLTKFRNFGMKSISEIKEVLTKLGLSLSSN
jgi:DNA-directed RNA polymerase alpha subunit